jgi:hypothetical protein
MAESYSIYCDESCHLENDHQGVMVLGALVCPTADAAAANAAFRAILRRHGLPPGFESKWTKVSPAGVALYRELLDFFFETTSLRFRAVVIPDKAKLDHAFFAQSHDDWYFKMYYQLLTVLLSPPDTYRIFLDVKDTRSAAKVRKLHQVLCNRMRDFSQETLRGVQTVHSHEVALLQMCDLMTGVVSYASRGLRTSPAKVALVEHLRQRTGLTLTHTTALGSTKFNILRWEADEVRR